MTKRLYFLMIALAVCLHFSAIKADAWGLTIEDIMEREGISRTDRVTDIRKLILEALHLEIILPWENYSPDLKEIIGEGAFNDIADAYNQAKETYKSIERSYKNVESAYNSVNSVVSGLERLDSVADKYADSIKETTNIDLSEFMETDAVTGSKTIDLYKAAKEESERLWSKNGQDTMREIGAAFQPFASAKAAIGANQVENSHEPAYADKAVADYAASAGQEMIQKIILNMAEAQVLADKIKAQGHKLNESYMGAYVERQSSFANPGGAWKATAAGYTTLNKLRLGKDDMMMSFYKMVKIRFKLKTYQALLKTYDYAEFCRTALRVKSEQAATN